jgi:hypothetical protein
MWMDIEAWIKWKWKWKKSCERKENLFMKGRKMKKRANWLIDVASSICLGELIQELFCKEKVRKKIGKLDINFSGRTDEALEIVVRERQREIDTEFYGSRDSEGERSSAAQYPCGGMI